MNIQMGKMRQQLLTLTYVNCWTLGNIESVAMWRLYTGDENGIAIESSFRRLRTSFAREPLPIWAGRVRYVDYDADLIPEESAFDPFAHKRRAFTYEREVRAVTSTIFDPVQTSVDPQTHTAWNPPSPPGIHVEVDLANLIRRVRVSPVSAGWFVDLVEELATKYGLAVPVLQSELEGEPVY
jgi:hypothetical protein